MEACPQSIYCPNTKIERVQLSDGVGSPLVLQGESFELEAKSLLLATGGKPKIPTYGEEFDSKLRSSDYIQRQQVRSAL